MVPPINAAFSSYTTRFRYHSHLNGALTLYRLPSDAVSLAFVASLNPQRVKGRVVPASLAATTGILVSFFSSA